MDEPRILSGGELVARGTTKIEGSLPEVGLKDVVPNGTWLEQKQVQSALESRKHLIETERIEKSGSLSHAEWREDLMLAEVTQKVGGHWQYFGHYVGGLLYLYPEEALFLMEINALRLKYNDVTVSLQQAYSLLLRAEITLCQYKVFASLSRVGYKVFRHQVDKNLSADNEKQGCFQEDDEAKKSTVSNGDEEIQPEVNVPIEGPKNNDTGPNAQSSANGTKKTGDTDINMREDSYKARATTSTEDLFAEAENVDIREMQLETETVNSTHKTTTVSEKLAVETETKENPLKTPVTQSLTKLQKLESRQLRPSNPEDREGHFQIVPNMFQKQIVTITVPRQELIPKNVFVNKTAYKLNLETLKRKETSNDSGDYLEEVNGSHVRRVRDRVSESSNPVFQNNWSFLNLRPPNFGPPLRPFRPPLRPFGPQLRQFGPQFRPFGPQLRPFWRPQQGMDSMQWNWFMNVSPFTFFPRPPLLRFPNQPNPNVNNTPTNGTNGSHRKRSWENTKRFHMEAIKKLAARLRTMVQTGNTRKENIDSLNRLISNYNTRYQMNLRLTEHFELYTGETILDTIELDDDDEGTANKRRRDSDDKDHDENLNKIKDLAAKLKVIASKNKATARHRRVMSGLIKKFNKTFNADICLKNNEIVDRRLITVDTSSESDCVIEERPKQSGKKLRNPFNILKRLSQKSNRSVDTIEEVATVSQVGESSTETKRTKDTSEDTLHRIEMLKEFGTWLPGVDDFGKPEVPDHNTVFNFVLDQKKVEYLYEFMKNHPGHFRDWLELKIGFLKAVVEAAQIHVGPSIVQPEPVDMSESKLSPIIGPEDCADKSSILKKLSIIKTCTASNQNNLNIDFDVYNRDVQNFRKTNRPKPHFRVICMSESTPFPNGSDVAGLHAAYDDGITILFAAVGISSISYLQINPTELSVYVPSNSDVC